MEAQNMFDSLYISPTPLGLHVLILFVPFQEPSCSFPSMFFHCIILKPQWQHPRDFFSHVHQQCLFWILHLIMTLLKDRKWYLVTVFAVSLCVSLSLKIENCGFSWGHKWPLSLLNPDLCPFGEGKKLVPGERMKLLISTQRLWTSSQEFMKLIFSYRAELLSCLPKCIPRGSSEPWRDWEKRVEKRGQKGQCAHSNPILGQLWDIPATQHLLSGNDGVPLNKSS